MKKPIIVHVTPSPFPTILPEKVGCLSVMLTIHDRRIVNRLQLIYTLLTGRSSQKVFHFTLFRIYLNTAHLPNLIHIRLQRHFQSIVSNILLQTVQDSNYSFDVEYLNDKKKDHYLILNNFFTQKIQITRKYINTIQFIQKQILSSIFKPYTPVFHSITTDYKYWTIPEYSEPLLAIPSYYHFQKKYSNVQLHISICKINEIQGVYINRTEIELYQMYLQNYIRSHPNICISLYPSVQNKLYITYNL